MKKKVALFANGWSTENLRCYLEPLKKGLTDLFVDLYVFMGHDAYGMTQTYNESECCIYELPDMKNFDAAVFFTPGMDFAKVNDGVINRCREAGIPLISVGKLVEGAISICTDQYKGMKPLVDHLIEKHGVEKLLFIAGPKDNHDSNERLRALTDSCREHGVTLGKSDIFYANWDVVSAVQHIRKLIDNKKLPDAVVCANDNTAFFMSFVFEEKGLEAPKDVLLTGFDGTNKAKTFFPSITTVSQPFEKMAQKTAQCLGEIFDGEMSAKKYVIPCEFVIGESCGCDVTKESDVLRREICREIPGDMARSSFRAGRIRDMEYTILQSERYATMGDDLREFFYTVDGQEGNPFYLFLDPSFALLGERDIEEMPRFTYADELDMVVGKCGKTRYEAESIKVKENILPEMPEDEGNHILFFMPLAVESFVCGYMVMSDNLDYLEKSVYSTFHSAMNKVLETFVKNLKLSSLNDKLSELLNKDVMTGVRNRSAYESYMLSLKDRVASGDSAETAFVMFDLNDLKVVNDTYGHEIGDEYIKNGCALICETFSHSIVFRIGGDEFFSVLWGRDFDNREKLLERFKKELASKASADLSPQDKVSIACGMITYDSKTGESVDDALKRADEAMYEDKHRIKAERK